MECSEQWKYTIMLSAGLQKNCCAKFKRHNLCAHTEVRCVLLNGLRETKPHDTDPGGTARRFGESMDIFEGTEQIQQLVISRAISGLRIE